MAKRAKDALVILALAGLKLTGKSTSSYRPIIERVRILGQGYAKVAGPFTYDDYNMPGYKQQWRQIVNPEHGWMSLSDIATILGIRQSSVYKILMRLQEKRIVEVKERGQFMSVSKKKKPSLRDYPATYRLSIDRKKYRAIYKIIFQDNRAAIFKDTRYRYHNAEVHRAMEEAFISSVSEDGDDAKAADYLRRNPSSWLTFLDGPGAFQSLAKAQAKANDQQQPIYKAIL